MQRVSSIPWPIGVAAAVPALAALFLVSEGGAVPHHDYWDITEEFFSRNGFSTDPMDWLTATRTHLMPVTYLLYAANIAWAGGTNLGLSLLTWGLAALQALLLGRLALRCGLGALWLPVVTLFCFTPVAAEPWLMGASGIGNVGAQSLSVASLYFLTAPPHCERAGHRSLGIAMAMLAGLTFSTALPVSLLAIVALVWGRAGWRWVTAAAVCTAGLFAFRTAMVAAFYAPDAPPPIRIPLPLDGLRYLLPLLGGLFTRTVEVGGAIAAIGLAAAGAAAWQGRNQPQARPWILLACLALTQSALISVGRWDLGPAQAVASRYAPVIGLFWLATLSLVALQLWRRADRFALGASVLACAVAMTVLGVDYSRTLLHQASLQPAAVLSIQYKIPDHDAVKIAVTPWSQQFLRNLGPLRRHGLAPFDRPLVHEWGRARDDLLRSESGPNEPARIGLQRFRPYGVRMMALEPNADGSIVLINERGQLRGSAVPLRRAPYRDVVWVGYARITEQDQRLVVVRVPDDGPPVIQHEVALRLLPIDERGLQVFKRIRELPRAHRAGRSLR